MRATCESQPAGLAGPGRSVAGIDLGRLAAALPAASLRGAAPERAARLGVRGVRQDSRRIEPGEIFVALRGVRSDGARFIADAAARGAVAVMLARGHDAALAGLPCLEVAEPRYALARAAAIVYGEPTRRLEVVGITGTNGKTTTAHLLQACIDAGGGRAGIAGTLGCRFADFALGAGLTSPEADDLQRFAAELVGRGATHMVMEVSSVALEAQRVAEVAFRVALFTNLTQDHLDYHGTMERYGAAKERLFVEHAPAAAVINVDDPFGATLAARLRATGRMPVVRVSCSAEAAVEVKALRVEPSARGMALRVRWDGSEMELDLPLVGRHNAYNALCALGAIHALGLSPEQAAVALRAAPVVPGRLERCDDPARDDIVALVDYAHTPDALARVLDSLRPLCRGELWCVFGCGGDRDPDKRAPMGEAVAARADRAIVTNDNPRSEDPRAIAAAVARGLTGGGARHEIELERARAIDRAVTAARPGDVVLVAGKGHESYQVVGERVLDFDDRIELRRALLRRRCLSERGKG
ncbi:MAG: UDP-N-acetylmuramoyl-L-alanyl-D-glutamate--2,6-diaminopimelate ligase [Deltaproteobacteria bacterium]|nr:UDP-N-acetylmuramoyl-L-alanyl-D-glutamate--2,6-diaminopimelate ligase [Deltaproteobacteria bacterium]